MFSKRVTLRSSLAKKVASAAEEWSAATTETLIGLLVPYLGENEVMPDVALLQQLLARLVSDQGRRLVAGDDLLQVSLREARALRSRRDEAAEELREMLRSARFYFDQVNGRGSGAKFGIGHGLSWMASFHLARTGEGIAHRLELTKPPAKKSKFGGLPDPVALAAAIREQSAKLEDLILQLKPQTFDTVFARGEQIRGLEETERIVRRCAGVLAEIYKLCGWQHLAKEVRPVFRRKSRRKQGAALPAATPPASTPTANQPAEAAPAAGILADLDFSEIRVAEAREPTPRPRSRGGRRFVVRRRS